MSAAPETRRLFFALWPDPEVRSGIVSRRAELGVLSRRRVPDHNLHLTLLFLGAQPASALPAVEAAADGIEATAFLLVLDRFGGFREARVVWLGGAAVENGQGLVDSLADGLSAARLTFDRRPWVPHVTLFRQVRQPPVLPETAPLPWTAQAFSLVESIPGQPYQVLRTWPLESATDSQKSG